MTDQPADHDNHVTDHEPTSGDGRDQSPTDHATTPALLTLEEAASGLGITVNAVRQRIKRGTLIGIKTDAGWLVDVDHRPAMDRPLVGTTNHPASHATTPTDHQPTIDLAPLADVIRDQNRRLEELSSTAAMWQTRAAHLEDQLKQLTAGTTPPSTPPEGPRSPRTSDTGLRGVLAWVRRWLAGGP